MVGEQARPEIGRRPPGRRRGSRVPQLKKKISDMLGPQWSKEELERFYEAYRKYGKDWKKVAGAVRNNRSPDMVETLYNMNKAYLSLPEGTATLAGLIAMMTDHYNIMDASNSDRESNDVSRTPRKPQQRSRGKVRLISKGSDGNSPDHLQNLSTSSSYGCLSLLKKKRSGDIFAGSRPRAVGKRTPRIPVSYTYGKDDRAKFTPTKLGVRSGVNSADDEGAHVAALALAEASQRGGSPQISRTPGRRMDHVRSSPPPSDGRKNGDSEMVNSKFICDGGDAMEGSLESREAENADFSKDINYLVETEGAGTTEILEKVKRLPGKASKENGSAQLDDEREACSGTEEGLNIRKVKDEEDVEVADGKYAQVSRGSRKRSRQLYFGDESSGLDALETLADLSLNILMPASTVESESSVQVKEEEKNIDVDEKPSVAESLPINHQRERSKIPGKKEKSISAVGGVDVVTRRSSKLLKGMPYDSKAMNELKDEIFVSSSRAMRKRKRKPMNEKVSKSDPDNEYHASESQKMEASVEEGKRSTVKSKRVNQGTPPAKQGKLVKPPERSSPNADSGRAARDLTEATAQISMTKQSSLPTKARTLRKSELKALAQKDLKPGENSTDEHLDQSVYPVNDKSILLKEKFSHCVGSRSLRRWCVYEWFYSAIDYPWFAKSEFVEYLNHVRLGHIPRLTRVEWGVIRSSLGKPRRLSDHFLREEREKLEQYRESVRTHYSELRSGVRDGLPTDLARPLSVGQRVIAYHPKTREIHDGSILTVDSNRCRVQFDRPDLGVEFVVDINCMPLSPSENMPEVLRRQNIGVDRYCNSFTDIKLDDQPKDWKIKGAPKSGLAENLDMTDGISHITSNYSINTLLKQAKEDTVDATVQAKAAANEVAVAAQQAMYSQPCTLAQLQAREADIRALTELTRALDKKEALLLELRHMNEEVSGKQKDGDFIKDFEIFKKQYALVLLQLRDANDQVAAALLYLRQRNSYNGNSTPPWIRPMENSEGPAIPPSSYNPSAFLNREAGCHVVEIVDTSRRKARVLVGAAVQAVCSLKEGDDAFVRVGEALDFPISCNPEPCVNSRQVHADSGPGNSVNQETTSPCLSEPTTLGTLGSRPQISSDSNGTHYPSELITSCVATLLMIQTCTERQYPPAEVAQILDSALTSLQPYSQQNLPVYREIETCMGIIKNQMLALLPTPSAVETPIM
ncbi:putative transcription factor MYB-HB-like family [Dioscorea sansibarensis]